MIEHVEQVRANGIGASDAAGVLGLDPRNPPIKIWRRLRGLPPLEEDRDAALEEASFWGHVLEPVIRGVYVQRTKQQVIIPGHSIMHPSIRWLHATPDGYVIDNLSWSTVGVVQIKNQSAWRAHEWGPDLCPRSYRIQVETEMAVTRALWADLVALIGGNRYVQVRVHRDLKREEILIDGLASFQRLVDTGVEPSIDGSKAHRRHLETKMRDSDVEIVADETMEAVIDLWRDAVIDSHRVKDTVARAQNTALSAMAKAGARSLRSKHGVIRYTATGRITRPRGWGDSDD